MMNEIQTHDYIGSFHTIKNKIIVLLFCSACFFLLIGCAATKHKASSSVTVDSVATHKSQAVAVQRETATNSVRVDSTLQERELLQLYFSDMPDDDAPTGANGTAADYTGEPSGKPAPAKVYRYKINGHTIEAPTKLDSVALSDTRTGSRTVQLVQQTETSDSSGTTNTDSTAMKKTERHTEKKKKGGTGLWWILGIGLVAVAVVIYKRINIFK